MTPEEKADFISKWKKMQENKAILYTAPEGIERTLAMAYKSPIEIIQGELETKIENDIIKAVQHYDIRVDKDELFKALQYDRKQYEQGWEDARKAFQRPTTEWQIIGEETGALGITYQIKRCTRCGWSHSLMIPNNFCPRCGGDARTQEPEEEDT